VESAYGAKRMLYPPPEARACAVMMTLCPLGADVMLLLPDACRRNLAVPVGAPLPKFVAVCAKMQYRVPCSSPAIVGASDKLTLVDAGTAPELVEVNEPRTTDGWAGNWNCAPVDGLLHVDGTKPAALDGAVPGEPALLVPAMDIPSSNVVAPGRPRPVRPTEPPMLATVGIAVRLAVRTKMPSWYCPVIVVTWELNALLLASGEQAVVQLAGPAVSVAVDDIVDAETALKNV